MTDPPEKVYILVGRGSQKPRLILNTAPLGAMQAQIAPLSTGRGGGASSSGYASRTNNKSQGLGVPLAATTAAAVATASSPDHH